MEDAVKRGKAGQNEKTGNFEAHQHPPHPRDVNSIAAPDYSRLVLTSTNCEAFIDRAHREVGHVALLETPGQIAEGPGYAKLCGGDYRSVYVP